MSVAIVCMINNTRLEELQTQKNDAYSVKPLFKSSARLDKNVSLQCAFEKAVGKERRVGFLKHTQIYLHFSLVDFAKISINIISI